MTDQQPTMTPAQRATGWLFAIVVGLSIALYAYQRVSDPVPRQQRLQEETVVLQARALLTEVAAQGDDLEISDPLDRNRVAGKVYIYPVANGWQVSGHYRRNNDVMWQPWLMTLDEKGALVDLSVQDPALQALAASDPRVTYKVAD